MNRGCCFVPVAIGLVSCRIQQTFVEPDPHLNRMLQQHKVLAYDENALLPAGMAMQLPPEGTMPVNAFAGNPLLVDGVEGDRYAERIPIPIDRPLVEIGRQRFETFCAACHGVLGDGASVVAEKMALRKPPSLLEERIRNYPPGRIFQTVREGYGLMPSYAVQISIRDSWGVTAYVRALQLARHAPESALPADLRAELEKHAP